MPAAIDAAMARGTKARVENSNSRSSKANRTDASGAPKVAAIPAAAPAASRILRSAGETSSTWPRREPKAPPVTMIGPSAPKGPPVPIAMAADSGFATAVLGAIRLCRVSTTSIASGMPCPRIAGDHRASMETASPPTTAAATTPGPARSWPKDGMSTPRRWNRNRLVIRPMSFNRRKPAKPLATPRTTAQMLISAMRRGCDS